MWGAFCREFQFQLGSLAGECLGRGVMYMLSLAIHFGTSGRQLFPESSHLNFGGHHLHGAMIFSPL